MLRYLNYGQSSFKRLPDLSKTRLNWEFFAVMEGRCAPRLDKGGLQPWRTSTLWLFPPWMKYDWESPNKRCVRAVFHVAVLPEIISQNLPSKKFYEVPITAAQGKHVLKLAREIHPFYLQPDATYELRVNCLINELCLMVLKNISFSRETPLPRMPESRVSMAENFYRMNIDRCPSVDEAAAAAGVSPSQLRRIFRMVRKVSPQQAFRDLRLQCACRLLAGTDWTLEAVAAKSGFKSAIDFHRSFKAKFKATPHFWRTHLTMMSLEKWRIFSERMARFFPGDYTLPRMDSPSPKFKKQKKKTAR